MAIQYAQSLRNTRLDAVDDDVNAGVGAGTLRIYSGTKPATPDTALSGNTLLAQLTCSDPFAGAASGGVLTASAITADSSADNTGTASFFRILDSDSNVVMQGDCGLSGSDLNMDSLSITAGQQVSVSSFAITEGNA